MPQLTLGRQARTEASSIGLLRIESGEHEVQLAKDGRFHNLESSISLPSQGARDRT